MLTDKPMRRSNVMTFDAPTDHYTAAAILVTQDESGEYHHFTKTGPGFAPVPDDTAALFAQAVELVNIDHNPEGN